MGRDAAQTEDGRYRLLVEAVTDYAIWVLILIASRNLGLHTSSRCGIGMRQMRVEDYFANGKRWWVRLHEKGGKRHEMPAHHKLEAFLDEYLRAADVVGD